MATTVFHANADEMNTWETDDFGFLLLDDTYAVDRDDVFVADLVAAEIGFTNYARAVVTSPTKTVDNTLNRMVYDCADPNFGDIIIGETVEAMVLYKSVTDDADSLLIAYYELGGIATTGLDFIVTVSPSGILFGRQG